MKIGDDYDQHLVTGNVSIGSEIVEGWSSKLDRSLIDGSNRREWWEWISETSSYIATNPCFALSLDINNQRGCHNSSKRYSHRRYLDTTLSMLESLHD